MALFSSLKKSEKLKKSFINPLVSRNIKINMRIENPKQTYDLFNASLQDYPKKVRSKKFGIFR